MNECMYCMLVDVLTFSFWVVIKPGNVSHTVKIHNCWHFCILCITVLLRQQNWEFFVTNNDGLFLSVYLSAWSFLWLLYSFVAISSQASPELFIFIYEIYFTNWCKQCLEGALLAYTFPGTDVDKGLILMCTCIRYFNLFLIFRNLLVMEENPRRTA